MDMVRQYISAATDRPEHTIEQADAEVAGAAATPSNRSRQSRSPSTRMTYRRSAELSEHSQHGYEDSVQLVKAFDFVKSVENRYQFSG